MRIRQITLRDCFWITLIAAVAAAWYADRSRLVRQRSEVVDDLNAAYGSLFVMSEAYLHLLKQVRDRGMTVEERNRKPFIIDKPSVADD